MSEREVSIRVNSDRPWDQAYVTRSGHVTYLRYVLVVDGDLFIQSPDGTWSRDRGTSYGLTQDERNEALIKAAKRGNSAP